mmetsp:Transcript_8183/g.13756  ORF Transcript_8183/g.13756 Transcript_8183/m.13756 type:complete len:218 (-) Transcript_8183:28-681(-)
MCMYMCMYMHMHMHMRMCVCVACWLVKAVRVGARRSRAFGSCLFWIICQSRARIHARTPSSLELDQVLRVRLGVVVRHEDGRAAHVVHRAVVELVRRYVAHVWGELITFALAVLANDDAARKHVLHAIRVGRRVQLIRRVFCVAREVNALAINGKGARGARERAIEALLHNLHHVFRRRAVKEPALDVAPCRAAALAHQHRPLFTLVLLPQRGVLHA